MPDKTDILQFMVVRPANLPDRHSLRRSYIHDDFLTLDGVQNADLFSEASESEINQATLAKEFAPLAPAPRAQLKRA